MSITGAGRLQNVKIQRLYGSRVKRGFVKVAVSRAVSLRECPLGELPLPYHRKQGFESRTSLKDFSDFQPTKVASTTAMIFFTFNSDI